MQMEVESQSSSVPRRVVAILAGALLVVAAVFAFTSTDAHISPPVDTALYTLAGFEVKVFYKCIFPTCTDFWCNANCNHRPAYCPASFCKKIVQKIPKPAPRPPPPAPRPPSPKPAPPPPPPPPPSPPPCVKVASKTDMTQCHPGCTNGQKLAQAERQKQKGAITTDQCLNCWCAGCDKNLFTKNCGGVGPTVAYCDAPSCCPDECLGGVAQIRPKMCTNCKCATCNPAFFGNNCNSKVPAACDAPATAMFATPTNLATRKFKCIDRWHRCTDWWCMVNCNHNPSYCPRSYCRYIAPASPPIPPPPPPPPSEPKPPTCPAGSAMGTSYYNEAGVNVHKPYKTVCCPKDKCGADGFCAGEGCGNKFAGKKDGLTSAQACCGQMITKKAVSCAVSGKAPCILGDAPANN